MDIELIENFSVAGGRICLMSAIRDILNYYCCNINESSLLGLCEGNLFYFGGLAVSNKEIEQNNVLKILKMGGMKYNIKHIMNILKEHMGLIVEGYTVNKNDSQQVKELVKQSIDRGIPLLALVMAYDLEYSVTYKKDYLSHTVNIFGYDFQKEQLYVTDTYVNTKPVSTYKGTLPLQNFLNSLDLSRAVFEMETEERIFALYPANNRIAGDIPGEIYRLSLKNMAKNNLSGMILGKDIYTGIRGIEELIRQLKRWFQEFNASSLEAILRGIHSLITNYGGPYVTSEMMGQYLDRIFEKEKNNLFLELAARFYEISRQWLILGNICYKMSLGSSWSFQQIEKRLYDICLKQEAVYKQIIMKLDEVR